MQALYALAVWAVAGVALFQAGLEPHWVTVALHVVVACSLLHNFLPPWEFLNDFPQAQKIYKVFVYLVGYVALNGRSTIYAQLSTKNGTQISPAANGKANGASSQAPANGGAAAPVPPPPAGPPKT